eukprot:TRINITY_DN346_c0_g1_i1.p1 TRINITY_DN346_c0_g1~~TRINITY_DN346_c0_g1_i1.p1  ORF type:complete len:92 (+),score=29.30 TRINITY_DN346_c0_g1_i1:67-342(+)
MAGLPSVAEAAARIFGYATGPAGGKLLKKPLIGPKLVSYYMEDIHKTLKRTSPEFVDAQLAFSWERTERNKARAKGPPPKGKGKRATRGKK